MRLNHGLRLSLEVVGGDALPLRFSVNPRARRVSIRIDARAGEAVVTAPSERRLADGLAFARQRAGWIAGRLAERPASAPLSPGATILLQGRPVRLRASGGAGAARLTDGPEGPEIVSGGEGEAFAHRVENLLKREARRVLTARTEAHLETLGQKALGQNTRGQNTRGQRPVTISVADTRSRWGSCSPHNRTIRYSWRVIMAPPAVIDYLAAHETAHLVHADHSPAFWSVVRDLVGDYGPHRRWLRDHGPALHAVGR